MRLRPDKALQLTPLGFVDATEVPELDVGESYSAWISLEQSAAPSRRIYWQTRERFTPIWPGPPKQPSERVPVETGPAPAEPSPARGPTKRCS